MTVTELLAEALVRLGVRHVFGVGGANIEDLFLAVQRRRPALNAIACKHEHGAGTAADVYARLSGGLGVAMVTSGGGAMNLVHALAEGAASRVRWLALVGEPPRDQQGCGAFQDTSGRGGSVDALAVYRAVTPDCTRLREPADLLPWLEHLLSAPATELPKPIVLLLAKDLQRAQVVVPDGFWERDWARLAAGESATPNDFEVLARALGNLPTAILAGADVARCRAQPELARLARALGACVAVTPDARDAFDNQAAEFLGVAGAMGQTSALQALTEAPALLLVGTRLPLLARQGLGRGRPDGVVLSIGREPPFIECAAHLPVAGDLRSQLGALAERLELLRAPSRSAPTASTVAAAEPAASAGSLGVRAVLEALDRALPEGACVLVDAGNTGASAVHQLRAPRAGRWLLALGMAGMGYSFGAALGAALATGRRVFVVAGDGAFYMHGLEIHTALQYDLPITYVVLDNAAHGMCLVREQLLLGESSGYNSFRRSRLAAGLAAMFPGLATFDCHDPEQLRQALAASGTRSGPCFVCAQLPDVEIPPFAAFRAARDAGVTRVDRGEPTCSS